MPKSGSMMATRHPGIYARANRDGSTTYICKPRLKGWDGPATSWDKLSEAVGEMNRIRTLIKEGRVPGSMRRTLSDAIDLYLDRELPALAVTERRNRERHLEFWRDRRGGELLAAPSWPGWVREDLQDLREVGLRGLGMAKPRKQRAGEAAAAISQEEEPDPVSYATTNRYRASIQAVFSACVDWSWIRTNPLHNQSRRKRPNAEREIPRNREITEEEWEALRPWLQASTDPRLFPLVICAIASGGRAGEILQMEWARLDLYPEVYIREIGERRVGVPRATVPYGKGGEARTLYFPGPAGAILRELGERRGATPWVWDLPGAEPARCPGSGESTLRATEFPRCPQCLAYLATGRPVAAMPDHSPRPVFPTGQFRYAKKMAGVRDLRYHDLRAEWAVSLCEVGVSSETEGKLLGGWSSGGMFQRYARRAFRRGAQAVDRLAEVGLRLE